MAEELEIDRKVLHYLKENPPSSKALPIGKHVGCTSTKGVNPRLYRLQKEGLIMQEDSQPPLWKLTEKGIGQLTALGDGVGSILQLGGPVNTQTSGRHASGDTITGGSASSRSSASASRHASGGSATGSSSDSRMSTGRHSSGDTVSSRSLVSLHSESHNSPNGDAQTKVNQYEALIENLIEGVKKIDPSVAGCRTCYEDYELLKVLGSGGFGVVLEAKRKDLDRGQYAIKIIKMYNKPDLREKMTREVKAMVLLNHPNIVRYYNSYLESSLPTLVDGKPVGLQETVSYWQTEREPKTSTASSSSGGIVFADNASPLKGSFYCGSTSAQVSKSTKSTGSDDFPFMRSKSTTAAVTPCRSSGADCSSTFLVIFMELCSGGNLADWLIKNVQIIDRPKEKIKKIFKSIVKAIDYLHEKNLMHRDIKPQNILFDGSGNIKVTDFGLAKEFGVGIIDDVSDGREAQFTGLHTSNKGTPSYMSPEQETNNYDNKVDIYALGIVLVELWCPLCSGLERQKCFNNLRLPRPVFPDSLPQELLDFVKMMLSHNPSDRPTARQVLEFIKEKLK